MSKTNKIDIKWQPTKGELVACIICILVVGFMAAFAIIAYTPLRNTIPGYPDATTRYRNVQNAMRIDSLEKCIYRWELYSENLRKVIEGADPIQIDSIIRMSENEEQVRDVTEFHTTDSLLRDLVAEEEKYELSYETPNGKRIEGIHFFKPVVGTVSKKYDLAQHPSIDLTAPNGSLVKSILDGHIIFTEWKENDQWIMIIQHDNGIISVYKNNLKLLKKTADRVSAGTAVAVMGDTYLHFELWHDGVPVDPALFIKF